MDNAFSALGLSDALVSALSEMGFEEPTPIQTAAIPFLTKSPGAPQFLC